MVHIHIVTNTTIILIVCLLLLRYNATVYINSESVNRQLPAHKAHPTHTHTEAGIEGPQVLYPHNYSHPRTEFSMWTTLPHKQECLLWIYNSFTGRDLLPASLRSRIPKISQEMSTLIPTYEYNSGQQPATHSKALYYWLVRHQQQIVHNDYCT